MIYRLLADVVLVVHPAFVVFAVLGGLLVLRHQKILGWHLAALAWGVIVQWADWICPLTPLENMLRRMGGEAGYSAGFIEHFVIGVLYPENLTLELRYLLGAVLLAVNIAVYSYVILGRRRRAIVKTGYGAHG
jgi:hypothetical protein